MSFLSLILGTLQRTSASGLSTTSDDCDSGSFYNLQAVAWNSIMVTKKKHAEKAALYRLAEYESASVFTAVSDAMEAMWYEVSNHHHR